MIPRGGLPPGLRGVRGGESGGVSIQRVVLGAMNPTGVTLPVLTVTRGALRLVPWRECVGGS